MDPLAGSGLTAVRIGAIGGAGRVPERAPVVPGARFRGPGDFRVCRRPVSGFLTSVRCRVCGHRAGCQAGVRRAGVRSPCVGVMSGYWTLSARTGSGHGGVVLGGVFPRGRGHARERRPWPSRCPSAWVCAGVREGRPWWCGAVPRGCAWVAIPCPCVRGLPFRGQAGERSLSARARVRPARAGQGRPGRAGWPGGPAGQGHGFLPRGYAHVRDAAP